MTRHWRKKLGYGEVTGPITAMEGNTVFHGDESHKFMCYPEELITKSLQVKYFDWATCTFEKPQDFCGNFKVVRLAGAQGTGVYVYQCLGHELEQSSREHKRVEVREEEDY